MKKIAKIRIFFWHAWKLHDHKNLTWLANWLQPPFTAQHWLQQAVATKQCAHRRFQYTYRISSYSFRGNYSFLNLKIVVNSSVSIFYLINWSFAAGNYSREENYLRRKLYEEIRYLYTSLSRSIRNSYFFRKYLTAHRPNDKNTFFFVRYYVVFLMTNFFVCVSCRFFTGVLLSKSSRNMPKQY